MKIILIFVSSFFSLFVFAQNKEAATIKTTAILPRDFETYSISLGNFKERIISTDSLKLLADEKINVKSKGLGNIMKVDKFTLTYMRNEESPVVLLGTNDTLTTKMRDIFLHAERGDVFYIEAYFLKNNLKKSVLMSLKVK